LAFSLRSSIAKRRSHLNAALVAQVKMIVQRYKLSFNSREWFYSFRELQEVCDDARCTKVSGDILKKYAKLTKCWNEELNSEWTCRSYFATKMILNATVLLMNAAYAEEKNLRVVKPYLHYYAVLSLLRCIVYTLPEQQWDDGKLIQISHTKAINLAMDWLGKFNQEKAKEVKHACSLLKAQREIISYRAPASGDENLSEDYDIVAICTLLAEIAQFNSVLLESSIDKNASPDTFVVDWKDMDKIISVEIEGFEFIDRYDAMRLSYNRRKTKRPYNLVCFMTEGQIDDFFGAWDDSEDPDNEEVFNTGNAGSSLIFDIP